MRWLNRGLLVMAVFSTACAGVSERVAPTTQAAKEASASTPDVRTGAPEGPAAELEEVSTWTSTLDGLEDFERLARTVGNERYVKLLIEIRSGQVWYFDSKVYPEHMDFALRHLYPTQGSTPKLKSAFQRNYGAEKPNFLLCTLAHHSSGDIWTFSVWEGDQMGAQHVESALNRIKASFWMASKLRFLAHSPRQEALARTFKRIPHISSDSLYQLANEHTFNVGRRVGVLRYIGANAAAGELTFEPHQVVVLAEPIPEITAVAGIVSEQFSTPLAHANLRAAAWGIPHLGLRGAWKRYKALAGKVVFFEARADGHVLREATKEEAQLVERGGRLHTEVRIPSADLEVRELRPLERIRATDAATYGAKTANLGEVAQVSMPGLAVPAGFGIPIHYSEAHLQRSGLRAKITSLLTNPRLASDTAWRKEQLRQLRTAIEQAPLDPELMAEVSRRVKAWQLPKGSGVFVRSSTNAEDLPGFTGAGLYTTVPNVIGDEALARAIRTVWASVWNFRAFEEREFHGIDHNAVHGAVLIQVGVDATAAGVLITTNIFDGTDRDTYTINAKSGLGMRVVEGKNTPEQVLYAPKHGTIKVLSRSHERTMLRFDPKGGVREVPNPAYKLPVLHHKRVALLGRTAAAIAKRFAQLGPLDIEWVFGEKTLYIVQARAYVTR